MAAGNLRWQHVVQEANCWCGCVHCNYQTATDMTHVNCCIHVLHKKRKSISGRNSKINRLAPPLWGLAPSPEKSRIRHCLQKAFCGGGSSSSSLIVNQVRHRATVSINRNSCHREQWFKSSGVMASLRGTRILKTYFDSLSHSGTTCCNVLEWNNVVVGHCFVRRFPKGVLSPQEVTRTMTVVTKEYLEGKGKLLRKFN